MKNNPKYVKSLQKIIPFRPILHEFDTLFTLRTYSAQLWMSTLLREFLDKPDTLDIRVAPRDSHTNLLYFGRNFEQNHPIFQNFLKFKPILAQVWENFEKSIQSYTKFCIS